MEHQKWDSNFASQSHHGKDLNEGFHSALDSEGQIK